MTTDNTVQEFWEWFPSVSDNFGDIFENNSLIHELDERIGTMGPMSWQIGPGIENEAESSLVFSPAGDKSLLSLTRRIVTSAPPCKGWEFYSSIPPKKWQQRFMVQDDLGKEHEVNAAKWFYVLLRYPDNTIDIMIEAPGVQTIPTDILDIVGEILVDGEIGEEQRITTIDNIECVPEFDDSYRSKRRPITLLAAHLSRVLADS